MAWIQRQTGARLPRLAVFAATATNIERQANPVADLDLIYRFAHGNDLAQIFMAQNTTGFHVGASFIHVQVRPGKYWCE